MIWQHRTGRLKVVGMHSGRNTLRRKLAAGLLVPCIALLGVAAGFHGHALPDPTSASDSSIEPVRRSVSAERCPACRLLNHGVSSPLEQDQIGSPTQDADRLVAVESRVIELDCSAPRPPRGPPQAPFIS